MFTVTRQYILFAAPGCLSDELFSVGLESTDVIIHILHWNFKHVWYYQGSSNECISLDIKETYSDDFQANNLILPQEQVCMH